MIMYMSYVLAAVITFFTFIYFYLTRNFNYWKVRNIQHKQPIFLFGNLLDVVLGRRTTTNYLTMLYNEFKGPYFGIYGMDEPFLVVKDTNIIKRILVKDFSAFSERTFPNDVDPIFSNTLFAMKTQIWRRMRHRLTPLFTSGKIKRMFPLIAACGENMRRYLENKEGEEIEAKELAAKYTTGVITSCVFGIDASSFLDENSPFRIQGRKFFTEKFTRAIQPLAYVFAKPLAKILKLKFVEPTAASFYRDILLETIEHRENTGVCRNDLIDTLISLKNENTPENEIELSCDKLVSHAISFYFAGHESTSSAISFTLLELAIHPSIQDRLRKEIQDVTAAHRELKYEAIQDMKYLDMIVSETLRKYAFTPFIHRRCMQNYVIPETGLELDRGLGILFPVQGLHWDPQYFPEPEKFNPERFNEANISKIVSYSYLPFGVGPRNCIGDRFGLLNTKIGIIKVVAHYRIEKTVNTKYPLQFGRSFLVQPIGGVPLTFKKL